MSVFPPFIEGLEPLPARANRGVDDAPLGPVATIHSSDALAGHAAHCHFAFVVEPTHVWRKDHVVELQRRDELLERLAVLGGAPRERAAATAARASSAVPAGTVTITSSVLALITSAVYMAIAHGLGMPIQLGWQLWGYGVFAIIAVGITSSSLLSVLGSIIAGVAAPTRPVRASGPGRPAAGGRRP